MLGRAKSVKVQKENTVIVDGAGNQNEIAARISQIKLQIEEIQRVILFRIGTPFHKIINTITI